MLDEITISAIAGDGGRGVVSFRRERYVPRGGPDGGHGGRGGNVVLEATTGLRVLDGLRRQRTVRADSGGAGGPSKKRGRDGSDIVVQVPVGTIVWTGAHREEQLADLARPGQRVCVAEGGMGGRGNASLATSTRRAPRFAEKGLTGEKLKLRLELRLLAEVGLVGLPNAGKSSLLRALSDAMPKVGAYPFTTLEPHLGVLERRYDTVVMADIPGLIEGAHEGAGLGMAFLQHIRRTRLLVHVVDVTNEDPGGDIAVVRKELVAFDRGLAERPWLVALNKIDLEEDVALRLDEVEAALRGEGVDAIRVSARTGAGVSELEAAVFERVGALRSSEAEAAPAAEDVVVRPVAELTVRRIAGAFRVRGRRPEAAAQKLDVTSEEAKAELVRRLRRMGAITALRRAGVKAGDAVLIGEVEMEWPL